MEWGYLVDGMTDSDIGLLQKKIAEGVDMGMGQMAAVKRADDFMAEKLRLGPRPGKYLVFE